MVEKPEPITIKKIGNSIIKISDAYCQKTPEEIERILRTIAKTAQRGMNAEK